MAATQDFPTSARLIARRLPAGDIMVIGRDVNQLLEMRSIITSALVWSGASILLVGLTCGVALSIAPLRRVRVLQEACRAVARGDLKRRMPTSDRHDELDMFASTVNYTMDEVERLMSEVKGATETIAHDLLTPLARASTQLHRIQKAGPPESNDIAGVIAGIDTVLDRFRAILRIAELDAHQRRAGFSRVDLADLVANAAELYQPLAEDGGVQLRTVSAGSTIVEADPKLLFEAVANLLDNAIKYADAGGSVQLRLDGSGASLRIIVEDNGRGISAGERNAVLQRFYRAEARRSSPGSGLGLSVVAAIVRLHGFQLLLEDAGPGLRAIIDCSPTVPPPGRPG
jgi:signal transduction histidine kinase